MFFFYLFSFRYPQEAVHRKESCFSRNVSNYSYSPTTSVSPVCYCCEKPSQTDLHNKKVSPSIDQYRDTSVSNNVYICNNGDDYIWKT